MKNLFISWSGTRSQAVAEALHEWLPTVIQSVDPWLSIADIEKGTKWNIEITSQLQQLRVGIVCLTADNLNAPWLLFEAGALSKTIDKTFVCPYLLDIHPTDLQGPFAQFQATRAEKEDTEKLLHTINKALDETGIQDRILEKQFEKWWPELEKKLENVPKLDDKKLPKRQERDLLEEILQLVRSLARKGSSESDSWSPQLPDLEKMRSNTKASLDDLRVMIEVLQKEPHVERNPDALGEIKKFHDEEKRLKMQIRQLDNQIELSKKKRSEY